MDVPANFTARIERLSSVPSQVRWCDDLRFREENADGVSPGEFLNRFGWWVIGTTGGGNAIVVRVEDPAVYFAGHGWYTDEFGINYEELAGDKSWKEAVLDAKGVEKSLFRLAVSDDDFVANAGKVDAILDAIG
jgi:hypothetical protein